MAYTTSAFGTGNVYSATYPPTATPLYCFSPYYIEVTTASIGQTVYLNTINVALRRVSSPQKKARFDISEIIQSFFRDTEFGIVLAASSAYYNSKSKLVETAKQISISVDEDASDLNLTYDIVWGALQIGETVAASTEIYVWRNGSNALPLTITNHAGTNKGKDFWLSDKITAENAISDYGTYIVKELLYCGDGVYLRWINKGEYKYFYFNIGETKDKLEDGAKLNTNVWSIEPTNNEFKGDIRIKRKSGNQTIDCGVKTATYAQQLHLIGLQRSIKCWMLSGINWIAVNIDMTPINIDRWHLNKEINLTIIPPALFIEEL